MTYYPLLKNVHIIIALLSGIGFALRGYLRLILNRPLDNPFIRVAPHVVDTLLLATGIALWILAGWPFLSWLGLKIAMIVGYILLGIAAFRGGHSQRGVMAYLLALVLYVLIAVVAVHKPL